MSAAAAKEGEFVLNVHFCELTFCEGLKLQSRSSEFPGGSLFTWLEESSEATN
jgi:hypothetical protein